MKKVIVIDNIVYINVNDKAIDLWDAHIPLVVVFEDNTIAPIDYREEIDFALRQNVFVCIEGGPIFPCISWNSNTPRELINGHWYTKISDTKLVFNQ